MRLTFARAVPLLVALIGLAALVFATAGASAAPLPPASGDWVIDPGEIVSVSATNLTVEGNITLALGSELHLDAVRLVFMDSGAKRSVTGPPGSWLTIEASAVSASPGPLGGGQGYFMRVDGTLEINGSALAGLSGPAIPNPFAELEGIHLTSTPSRVTNSTITGAQGYAITASVVSAPMSILPTIADNNIQNCGGGVFLGGFVTLRADAFIDRNRFQLNALPHIAVSGSNPTIRGNSFVGGTAGVTVLFGSPRIENNSFLGTLLNAVSINQGGGSIEGNTVTATGVAFVVSNANVAIRNNTVTLSGTGLQATGATVTFDDNKVTGAFASAVLVNGTILTARSNTLDSSFGSPVLRATNGSTVRIGGGSLASTGGPGVSAEGGSFVLEDAALTASLSPFAASGTAVTLRGAVLRGAPADAVLSLQGGSLDATGGELTGGSDGAYLDGAPSRFNRTHIHGNGAWGIHAIHEAPQLSYDEIGGFVNANGEGDLLYEADLTALVLNAQLEPVANATVSIGDARGGPPLSGVTATDGRVGPVRLPVRRVDSLNNELAWAPYAVRAAFPPDFRGVATTSLATDDEVQITLGPNNAPTATLTAPSSALLNELVTLSVNASDPDGDPLNISWSVDDGRSYAGPVVHLSFDATGTRLVRATIFDGYETVILSQNVSVLTLAERNQPPTFVSVPIVEADLGGIYEYHILAQDPDSVDGVVLSLLAGPEGMALTQPTLMAAATLRWEPSRFYEPNASGLDITTTVSLRAWDGLAAAYQNFTVRLRGPADEPPVLTAIDSVTVQAGASFRLDLAPFGSDPDDSGPSLHWSVVEPNDTGGAFLAFDSAHPSVLVVHAPTGFEGTRSFSFSVVVTDPAGKSATREVHVDMQGTAAAAGANAALLPSLLSIAALAAALLAVLFARAKRKEE